MVDATKSHVEVIFIDYIDIIRTPWIKIKKYLLDNKDSLKGIINYDLLPEKDEEMAVWAVLRNNFNGLFDLGTGDYFYDDMLLAIEDQIPDLWDGNDFLEIGNVLDMVATQKVTKKIYVYTPYFDIRIETDLANNFKNSIVEYVYGDFNTVIKKCKPTTFILNQIEQFNALLIDNMEIVKETNVLVSKHLYNFTESDDTTMLKPNITDEYTIEQIENIPINFNMFTASRIDDSVLVNQLLFKSNDITFYERNEVDLSEMLTSVKRTHINKNRKQAVKLKPSEESYGTDEEEDVASDIFYFKSGSNEEPIDKSEESDE